MKKTTVQHTLDTLYNRATRAFLTRNLAETQSLLESAFTLLPQPDTENEIDALEAQRRRWDVLRITVETTLFQSSATAAKTLQLQTPHTLITTAYSRSLELFTPKSKSSHGKGSTVATVQYLPTQLLLTLVYSSLKLDVADVGRGIIEDYLAGRQQPRAQDGYEKILEVYCLQVLPSLEQWDYVVDFLEYEMELPAESRNHLKLTVRKLLEDHLDRQAAAQQTREALVPPPSSLATSPRSFSPAPSASSSSSSLSTTSTHTIVPSTSQAARALNGTSRLSSTLPTSASSSESTTSNGTATHTPQDVSLQSGFKGPVDTPTDQQRISPQPSHQNYNSVLRGPTPSAPPSVVSGNSSILAILKTLLAPYFSLSSNNLTTLLVLFVVAPILSFMFRRRRNLRSPRRLSAPSTAAAVRQRLKGVNGQDINIWVRAYREIARVVGDTVRMGGSGLV